MPKYLYKCNKCLNEFEKEVSLKKKTPKPRCPICNGSTRKLITLPVVQFKGKGFYSTDNKNEKSS